MNAGRRKLEHELKKQEARVAIMETVSPDTMEVMVQSIDDAFSVHAPFKEGTLMAAFKANPHRGIATKELTVRVPTH